MSTPAHPAFPPRDPPVRALLWRLFGRPLFRLSFHNWYALRRGLLRLFGARLAPTANFRPTVDIDRPWNLAAGELTLIGDRSVFRCRAPVTVGARCVVSQLATISTELLEPGTRGPDAVTRRTAPITIGDDCWVAADVLVLPGSTIAPGTVVGSRSLVDGDLPPWCVAVGEPARPIRAREFT